MSKLGQVLNLSVVSITLPAPTRFVKPVADAQADPPEEALDVQSESRSTDLESTGPHLTRLADEWQVGVDLLSPLMKDGSSTPRPALPVGCTANGAPAAGGADVKQAQPNLGRDQFRNVIAPSAVEGLAQHLFDSFRSGNTTSVMDILGLLNSSTGCHMAVLHVLRNLIVSHNDSPASVEWETGTDSSGKTFMRLKVSKLNDMTRTSGSTKLTIGSDGTAFAFFCERWNSQPHYLSPDEALVTTTTNARERVRDFNRTFRGQGMA